MRCRQHFRLAAAAGVTLLVVLAIQLRAGEITTITNLLQLRQFAQDHLRSVANLSLTGIVCEADAPNHFLILQDGGATELLGMEFSGNSLRAGQQVQIIGENCEVIRRRTGIGLHRLPLVDNDGLHGMEEKSAACQLAAGRQHISLEWFNAGGAAGLSVKFSGSNFTRTKIPDVLLSHEEFSATDNSTSTLPGLEVQSYEGIWRSLPDFGFWPESGRGVASNFTLEPQAQGEHIGHVFSGFLTVTQAGTYTFYLSSDDGSKLYLGELEPRVKVIGETLPPAPRPIFVGQIAGTNDPGLWSTVEGVVRYASPRGRRLELDLRSPSNNRMQVDVLDSTGLQLGLLLDSKVRLTGISRQVLSTGGQSIRGVFTVGGASDVQFVEVPNEIWLGCPLQTIAEASTAPNHDKIVRVSGSLHASQTKPTFELVDGTETLPLQNLLPSSATPKEAVEAIGVLHFDGTNPVLKSASVRGIYRSAATQLPLLSSAQQILQLPRSEAARGYPVHLRGIITCVWPDDPRNYVLQDGTHGVFLQQSNMVSAERASFGEFWDVQGVTGGGAFSPMIYVRAMQRVADGRLPEPAHAEWDQLVNGSLDNQYVEIEGVVLGVETNAIHLLSHSGRINIAPFGERPPGLEQFENKLVRLRGCLQAVWDGQTHQVKVGEIRLGNFSINADRAFSADPFAAPLKSVPELRLYDLQANAFRRVKVAGQFLQQRGGQCFMVSGTNGMRFIPNSEVHLVPGDLIEVAGVADLRGAAPMLREAVARKTGKTDLPGPRELAVENLMAPENDSTRVAVAGILQEVLAAQGEVALELRAGPRTFVARLSAAAAAAINLEPGSKLRVSGVYVWQPSAPDGGPVGEAFELLVRSPLDIEVLSRPPWWTFKKLIVALGLLTGVLALSAIWIVLLRRQVERRTAQLERANRQREQAERARVLDEERLRIARDLHDDLGSSLTEITMLGGMGLAEPEAARGDAIAQIVKKARDSVNALDVIVWAVNPRENTLQSLADYVASFADEFLSASGVACRLNLPVSFPEVVLEGRLRHDLFLATKEALNNAVRHARATEVDLSIALEQGRLVITVADNGCGFDPATKGSAHGLGNLRGRLAKLGGECQIKSAPGQGTTVALSLNLPAPS